MQTCWINAGVKLDWCLHDYKYLRTARHVCVKALQLLSIAPVLCFMPVSAKHRTAMENSYSLGWSKGSMVDGALQLWIGIGQREKTHFRHYSVFILNFIQKRC